MTCEESECTALFVGQLRHRTPVSVSRGGCSFRFGRARTDEPEPVHAMRGPNVGSAMSSGQRSALSTA
jgi:hypothetical protein